jgi:hypothetical protein
MNPAEPADLPSCETILRATLKRVQAAINGGSYAETIAQTLAVLPSVLTDLMLLDQVTGAHLDQLDDDTAAARRSALEELQALCDSALRARVELLYAAGLANDALTGRGAIRQQAPTELDQERNLSSPREDALIASLRAVIRALARVNKSLSLGHVDLSRPDQGGGAVMRNRFDFSMSHLSDLRLFGEGGPLTSIFRAADLLA